MQDTLFGIAARLTDDELLGRVRLLATREREATVELVAHLAELDTRKLHLAQGYGSLFSYCTEVLRLAEHAAYNRIEAARASRKFPGILDRLAHGSLNLSTVRLLARTSRWRTTRASSTRPRGRASARSKRWSRAWLLARMCLPLSGNSRRPGSCCTLPLPPPSVPLSRPPSPSLMPVQPCRPRLRPP